MRLLCFIEPLCNACAACATCELGYVRALSCPQLQLPANIPGAASTQWTKNVGPALDTRDTAGVLQLLQLVVCPRGLQDVDGVPWRRFYFESRMSSWRSSA